jgi:molybdopterin molybdotransferase
MKPALRPVSAAEARRILAGAATVVGRTTAALEDAAGLVLAEPLVAAEDLPAFRRSAMDGFAVRAADVAGASPAAPVWLALTGAVEVGTRPERAVGPGEGVAIPTGGHLPAGADAVVMVEQTELRAGQVGVREAVAAGRNVIVPGEDLGRGTLVLPAGRRLGPAELAVLAALGHTEVPVHLRPSVAVLSTGTELCPPGQAPPPGKVRDVNQYALAALAAAGGCEVHHDNGVVPDDPGALEAAVRWCHAFDVVLVSGGSSVGGRDHTAEVFERVGEILFHGIAVRPGRPTLVARAGGSLLVGLPGVPSAAMMIFEVFVRPLLQRLGGEVGGRRWPVTARLGAAYASVVGREDYLRVRLVERGGLWAEPLPGSSLSSALAADGYVVVPAEVGGIGEGELVEVLLLR